MGILKIKKHKKDIISDSMTNKNNLSNTHIENYLKHYINLPYPPHFSVLLKGKWGSGKTWFIKNFLEKSKEDLGNSNKDKYLYVSLYGMKSFAEIEYAFFEQLHPILSSKGMALAGTILRSFLKVSINFDLNKDSNRDGAVQPSIPEINLPNYLNNIDNSILIFDDLERCNIELEILLGYINNFVEHQGLKVILVANEDEILSADQEENKYARIKEKLIGKTFEINTEFENALKAFVKQRQLDNNASKVGNFLLDNSDKVEKIFQDFCYNNLRTLDKICLDFSIIYEFMPEKITNKDGLILNVLIFCVILSIEINNGNIDPKKLPKMLNSISIYSSKERISQHPEDEQKMLNTFKNIIQKYYLLTSHNEIFPNGTWWELFFDKGILDSKELENSCLNSEYFRDENTPLWIKLWHYTELDNQGFLDLLKEIDQKYKDRQFDDLGVIKHIFGLFLLFAENNLYFDDKQQILAESKEYINDLKNKKPKVILEYFEREKSSFFINSSYQNLGFCCYDCPEFEKLNSHIKIVHEIIIEENVKTIASDFLNFLEKGEISNCISMIYPNLGSTYLLLSNSFEQAVFNQIEPERFVGYIVYIADKNYHDIRWLFTFLKKRYENITDDTVKCQEMDWVKKVKDILEAKKREHHSSLLGFKIKSIIEDFCEFVLTI
jgi:hypothetical protein